MSKPDRVVVPLDPHEEDTFRIALKHAARIGARREIPEAVLLVHGRNQLQHTSLAAFLTDHVSRDLLNKKAFRLNDDMAIRAEFLTTLRMLPRECVVVAVYADAAMLDKLDGLHNVAGAVVIPWRPDGADAWISRWSPLVHGRPQEALAPLIADPVVRRALQALSSSINRSSGALHQSDKTFADQILRILRAMEHEDPSPVIKSWAIQNGWALKSALELEKLAQRIWRLKTRPSLAGFHDPHARYARWVEQARAGISDIETSTDDDQ
ncbi:hypothetical protein D3C71_182510 [compost metagenome]